MTELEQATAWNKEFCRLNNIPFNAKGNQIADKTYYETIARNNTGQGGTSFKLPGTILPPTPIVTPPPTVIPPTANPSIIAALASARETVRQLEMLLH